MDESSCVFVSRGELFPPGSPPIRVTTNFDHSPYDPMHKGRDLTFCSHSHDFSEVVIILGGSGRHYIAGESFPFMRGDVFRISPDIPHYFDADEKVSLVNLIFLPEVLVPWEGELKCLPGFQAFFNLEPELRQRHQFRSRLSLSPLSYNNLSEKLTSLREEEISRREGYGLSLQLKFIDLLVFLSREYDRMTSREAKSLQRIGKAVSVMEGNPEKDWTIEDLQQIVPVSRSTLRRLFLESVGHSPIDYLIGIRLDKARLLLEQTDRNVTEIAYATGFRDSNYFTRQFSARYGLSPLKYRRRLT